MRESWFLVVFGGVPLALARLDGRWSAVGRQGGRRSGTLDEAAASAGRLRAQSS